MRKNDVVILTVTDLNNLGFGVSHHEGLAVFVSGAVDGETVEAKVLTVKRSYAVAKTMEVLIPSPDRIEDDCPARGCGGCAYRTVTYAHETRLKRNYAEHAFRKAGITDAVIHPVVTPVDSDGQPLTAGYRNKAQFPIALTPEGEYRIGFYAAKSHRVVEAAACPLQNPAFLPILETLRAFFAEKRLTVWDETSGEGLLRHIYLRRGEETGEILLTLVVNGEGIPHEDELVRRLRENHPALVGILVNRNNEKTNVICGDTYRTLWGRDYLVDTLCGVRLKIRPAAFYQVNHAAATLLYRKARELAALTGKEQLLDLYCGIGSIGLSMADAVREVIGVEIEPDAVKCARENAAESGIQNAYFYRGDAGDPGQLLAGIDRPLHPDVVILDPPRKGSTPELLTHLATLSVPRIVYISCNVETLARDAVILRQAGYRMGEVHLFDLFPSTGHVESVVCLERRLDVDMRR